MEKKRKRRGKRRAEGEEIARQVLDGVSEFPLTIHSKKLPDKDLIFKSNQILIDAIV